MKTTRPPTFRYAGMRADAVPFEPLLLAAAEKRARETGEPMVVMVDDEPYRLSGNLTDALKDQYLVPFYDRAGSRTERREAMLDARINRFFGIAKKNINVARTCSQMDAELARFIDAYGAVRRNADFSLSVGYGEMTTNERKMVHQGSMLVGHIVNRMGRVGRIILHDGDTKGEGTLEDISELIERWSDDPARDLARLPGMHKPERDALRKDLLIKDFTYWADILTKEYAEGRDPVFRYQDTGDALPDAGLRRMLGESAPASGGERTFPRSELMRCVITNNDLRDHDGELSYLVYEIRKILTDEIMIERHEHLAESNPAIPHYRPKEERKLRDAHEARTIDGIVSSIGFTCRAIDETYDALKQVIEHPRMRQLMHMVQPTAETVDGEQHDVSEYRSMLRHYVELARRRCSINSRDAENFDATKLETDHLHTELRWLQDELRSRLDAMPAGAAFGLEGKRPLREGLTLMSRGLELIHSMAEERIPKNRNAPEVYDRERPEFKGRDASSVGRLREKVDQWVGLSRGRAI